MFWFYTSRPHQLAYQLFNVDFRFPLAFRQEPLRSTQVDVVPLPLFDFVFSIIMPSNQEVFRGFRYYEPPKAGPSSSSSPLHRRIVPHLAQRTSTSTPHPIYPDPHLWQSVAIKGKGKESEPIIISDTEDNDEIRRFSTSTQSIGDPSKRRNTQVERSQAGRLHGASLATNHDGQREGSRRTDPLLPHRTPSHRQVTSSPAKKDRHASFSSQTSAARVNEPHPVGNVLSHIVTSPRRPSPSKAQRSPSRPDDVKPDIRPPTVPLLKDPRRSSPPKPHPESQQSRQIPTTGLDPYAQRSDRIRPSFENNSHRAAVSRPTLLSPDRLNNLVRSAHTASASIPRTKHRPSPQHGPIRGDGTSATPIEVSSTRGSSSSSRSLHEVHAKANTPTQLSPTKPRSSAFGSHRKPMTSSELFQSTHMKRSSMNEVEALLTTPGSSLGRDKGSSVSQSAHSSTLRTGHGSSLPLGSHRSGTGVTDSFDRPHQDLAQSNASTITSSTSPTPRPFPLLASPQDFISPPKTRISLPPDHSAPDQVTSGRAFIAASQGTYSPKSKRQRFAVALDAEYRPKSRSEAVSQTSLSRPTRERPEPGRYALPAVDTPIHLWPTQKPLQPLTSRRLQKREKSAQMSAADKRSQQSPIKGSTASSGAELTIRARSRKEPIDAARRSASSSLTSLSRSTTPTSRRCILDSLSDNDTSKTHYVVGEEEVTETVEQRRSAEPEDIVGLTSATLILD